MTALSTPPSDTESDRRAGSRGGSDRRREAWRAFRHAYPTFLKVTATLFLLLVAVDMWLVARHYAYSAEIDRLRGTMTATERQHSELIIRSEQDKLRMAIELAKRQARWDPRLHLSIAVDSGRMYLERDGALLRDMRVTLAPERVPTAKSDSAAVTKLQGQRTIIEVRDGSAPELILNGGTRIYAGNDTAGPVTPGDVRASAVDLKAVLPNISAGTNVYFY